MKCKQCSQDAIGRYGYCGPCLGARARRKALQMKLLNAEPKKKCAECGKKKVKKNLAYCSQCYRHYKALTRGAEELDQLFEHAITKP